MEVDLDECTRAVSLSRTMDVNGDECTRTGNVWSATAHVVTAVIGSGVLALAWSVAQLGWVMGPAALITFAWVTYYTSTLLADCYRCPDLVTGTRNPTYMHAVKAYLGPGKVFMCGLVQYASLWGSLVGYTITAAAGITAVKQSHCLRSNGREAECSSSENLFMMAFGAFQIFLSQLPSFHNITWLSVVAAAMSFGYSFIGLCLGVVQWISNGEAKGSAAGAALGSHGLVRAPGRAWHTFQALGNIAFSYAFAEVLIEIQDTLKSPPPENKTMKKATMYGIGVTTAFYLLLGCTGYAAFGDNAPGNIFSISGFDKPFWLVDIANLFIVIHLLGAYQVFAQPIFAFFEKWVATKWPDAKLIHSIYTIRLPLREGRSLSLTLSKLILRSIIIVFTTLVAMLFPFFNAVLGFLGALAFWPLAVYFPVNMYMVQSKISRGMPKWFLLQVMNFVCLAVSLLATIGSVADIAENLAHARPFHTHS